MINPAPASFLILQEPFGKQWLTRETMADATPSDIAALVDDAQAFRVVRIDTVAGTSADATRDVLNIFASASLAARGVPADAIAAMLDAARLPYWTQADEDESERDAAAWERQLHSLRPTISTNL